MTTPTDMYAVFLADVVAHPEDDTPRLIFADWLEEHGQPGDGERAEFIRVQCELAYRGDKCLKRPLCQERFPLWSCCVVCDLRCRERELHGQSVPLKLCRPRPEWARPLSLIMPWYSGAWRFRRGFVEDITVTLGQWVSHGKSLSQAAPLCIVRLTSQPATTQDRLRGTESLLRHLICDDEPGDNLVCRLHTLDLTGLSVTRWYLDSVMAQAYRPWRGLKRLILPNWSDLVDCHRPSVIEQWKKRVPTLESVQFGRSEIAEEADA